MQETGNKISLSTKIVGASFAEIASESCELFIFFSNEEISFLVAEFKNRKFLALETWETSKDFSFSRDGNVIFSESELISTTPFRRVICCSAFRKSTLVPEALFDPATYADQLKFSVPVNKNDEIFCDNLTQVRAKNVFAVPGDVVKLLIGKFPEIEFHHSSTAAIGYQIANHKNFDKNVMTVSVHHTFFELTVIRGNQLLLCNSYDFNSAEEMVYHILFVCEQLQLNPETIHLQFAGKMYESDKIYSLCEKYIRHIGFIEPPVNYTIDSAFGNTNYHVYFNLFNQHICAS